MEHLDRPEEIEWDERRLWFEEQEALRSQGGVGALSGWAHTDRGEEAVFAILVNGTGAARALQDRIVRIIVAEG